MKLSLVSSSILGSCAMFALADAHAHAQPQDPEPITTIVSTIFYTVTINQGSTTVKTTVPVSTKSLLTAAPTGLYAAALGSNTTSFANTTSSSSSSFSTSSKVSSTVSAPTAANTSAPAASSAPKSNSGVKAFQLSSTVVVGAVVGLSLGLF